MNWKAKAGVKIKRNAPCPCGSGKKFKKCCFNNIVHPFYQKCSCGSGKEFGKCCYIVKTITGVCKECGKWKGTGVIRADGSCRFKCDNKACWYKFDSRKIGTTTTQPVHPSPLPNKKFAGQISESGEFNKFNPQVESKLEVREL